MILADIIYVEDLVVFSFRILNFLVIVALLVYGFKRFALPSLQEEYKKYYGYFTYLMTHHEELAFQSKELDGRMQEDQQEQDRLKERLAVWQEAVAFQVERKKQKNEHRQLLLKDRLIRQYATINERHLYAGILPLALADARARLIKEAANQSFQETILETSKKLLRKVSS